MPETPPAARRSLLMQGAGLMIASARAGLVHAGPGTGQGAAPHAVADRGAVLPGGPAGRQRLRPAAQRAPPPRATYTAGQAAWVGGTVTDTQGRPLAGGVVEIWQCDEAGHYHHPGDGNRADAAFQGFGKVTLAKDGRFRFRTLKPAPYTGRAPHIHVKVKLGAEELLTTQFYVQGDPGNARDGPVAAPRRGRAGRADAALCGGAGRVQGRIRGGGARLTRP